MSSESLKHNLQVELILSFLLNFALSFCKVYVPQAILHLILAEVVAKGSDPQLSQILWTVPGVLIDPGSKF